MPSASTSTVSALPDAASNTGKIYLVTDAGWPGNCLVTSDGTNWIRFDTSEVVRSRADSEGTSLLFNGTSGHATHRQADPPVWFQDAYERGLGFSIEIFFKPYDVGSSRTLVAVLDLTIVGILFDVISGGDIRLILSNTWSSNTITVQTTDTPCATLNEWYKATVSYAGGDEASEVTLVVDGIEHVLSSTNDSLSGDFNSINADFSIGSRQPAGAAFFSGSINQVRTWSSGSMTVAEMAHAQNGYAGVGRLDTWYRCGDGWDGSTTGDTIANNAGPGKRAGTASTTHELDGHLDNNNVTFTTDAPT